MDYNRIDGTGFPLAFKVAAGTRAATVAGITPARDVFRVEARTMGGHQKEVVVAEGEGGDVWRLTSDEGILLQGSDLAPFPLAWFNAGLHADFVNRALALARARGVPLTIDGVRVANQYYFQGSFLRGTGEGSAEAVSVQVAARSRAPHATVRTLLEAALAASPAHACLALPQRNTFALYVNGRRVPVTRVAASTAADQIDPFKAHGSAPAPLAGATAPQPLVVAVPQAVATTPPAPLPAEGRVPITIPGAATLTDPAGIVATTVTPRVGNGFCITCDERPGAATAPSGLAAVAAGIAFCYMTQFTRYIEYRKHKVRAIRFVQTLPFTLAGSAADLSLAGGLEPVDTHVFLHAEEPDAVMQNLLEVAENTCYLHAALRSTLPGRVELDLRDG
ncbi:MAG: OsmC family protein [Burkholderiales bacterium]|nr:OsmC family protein [Burkholderiales bacterium]